MRIILNEMRKIFELKIVALLILISFIIYQLFITFHFEYFPNGRPALDHYNISVAMLEDYGLYMDEHEFLHFKETYHENVEAANKYLQANEKAIETGITSYQEYRKVHGEGNNKSVDLLSSYIMFEEKVDLFWELQAREYLIDRYENKEKWMNSPTYNEKQKARINELIESEQYTAVFLWEVFNNYKTLITSIAVLIFLSIMIVISPIYVQDRRNNMLFLQYTTKTGRNLFKVKVIAGLLSAFIVITVQLICFFSIYSLNNVWMFLHSNINSVFNDSLFWFDLTFLQYIALTVLGIYILGFMLTLIVVFLSSIVPNYITVVGVQVPLFFLILWLVVEYLIIRVEEITLPMYLAPVVYLISIAGGILLILARWKKEKVLDIVH